MNHTEKQITPIFVLGSPRSGTTLIGNYISSNPTILDMGEYAAFDFTHRIAVDEMKTLPSVFKDEYLDEIQSHAYDFASRKAVENGCSHFCDSTPWTLLGVEEIVKKYPNAIFVLCFRSPGGVIQSLERTYKSGYKWAGATNTERFDLWKRFYSNIENLDTKNLIIFNYSEFCKYPQEELKKLNEQLFTFGFYIEKLDVNKFSISHATKKDDRRPVSAVYDDRSGLKLVPREDFNGSLFSHVELQSIGSDLVYKKIVSDLNQKQGLVVKQK